MALPTAPSSFYDGLIIVGESVMGVVPNLVTYAPYIFGLGLVNYSGEWLKDNRPRGSSEMTDDFWRYSAEGTIDLAKFSLMGNNPYGPIIPPVGGSSASRPMSSWGSTAMRFGNCGGLMGVSNPGVNRVAGQY